MTYMATARLTEDYQAIIQVLNSEPWTTTAWEVEDLADYVLVGDDELLYDTQQNGTGTLSEADTVITVTLPLVPKGDFLLTIGDFSKTFNLVGEGEGDFQPAIVGTGAVRYSTPNTFNSEMPGPNIVFFTNSDEALQGGLKLAGLFHNGVHVGYALGVTFQSVTSRKVYPSYHPKEFHVHPGVLFYRFIWLQELPSSVEDYTIYLDKISERGGSKMDYSFNLELGPSSAPSPTSQVYTVSNTDLFFLNGELL